MKSYLEIRFLRSNMIYTLILAAALMYGCATPVGVNLLTPQEANRELTESVLSNDSLSAPTQQLLNRAGLSDQFKKDPTGAIEALRIGVPMASQSEKCFALAELSFLHASQGGDQNYYLSAAIYAYTFLFPMSNDNAPSNFDPRLLTAVNLYNQGVALGFKGSEPGKVELKTDRYLLPHGELNVHLNPEELRWGPFTMVDFVSATQLEVRGLRNDYRWPGIGSSLVASLKNVPGNEMQTFSLVPAALKMPVTAFLRIENSSEILESGKLHADLVLYTNQEAASVEVNGSSAPLGFMPSAALAYTLEGSQVYSLELRGLLTGDLKLFKQTSRYKDNVFLMAPYLAGKIPLVLVHGTASSPARWAEVINEIINDKELSKHYQIWLFTYNTGNPILYSGGLLTQGLKNLVSQIDPEGKNEALRKMVVIGHSQGGMLTKLTAIDSGSTFWDAVFNVPIDQLEISDDTRQLLERSFFYKPLPFVKSVIFLSTPHRGSYLATNWVSNLLQRLISLPFTLLTPLQEVFYQDPSSLKQPGMKDNIPRSTDNMNPNTPFVKTFASIPLSPNIKAHSIIAVDNPEDPQDEWDDGVVTYQSAHIEGVESELIVRSSHSSQENPEAIEEIRRILMENITTP